ncbi:MAG: glycosyltransferase family 39 protein [Thermodesulfobacteriota bacterium]
MKSNNVEEWTGYKVLLFLLVAGAVLFRISYILWGPLDLSPDETHYWEWSRRLALSYYSKGPAIAYIIRFFTSVIGDSELGVRIGAVFISSLLTILIYLFAKKLFKSEKTAFFAALLPNITPIFSAGSILMTTDMPLLLLWGLALYTFYSALEEDKTLYWLLCGISIGLGLLSKYTMAMIYPSLFLFILLSKDDRGWLKRKEPYIAVFISLLIFIPVIVWNVEHDWVGFRHVAGQTRLGKGLRVSIKDFFEFFGAQAGILSPLIFIGLLYTFVKTGYEGLKGRRDYLFLFLTSAPILLFFLLKSMQGKVEANWAVIAYFTGLMATAKVFNDIYKKKKKRAKTRLFIILALSLGFGFVSTILAHYPDIINRLGFELSPKMDPTTRLKGWEELGEETGIIYQEMLEKGEVFILSDRYQIASELAFYIPEHPTTYNINIGRRMNQYDLWDGFYHLKGWDALYVKMHKGPINEKIKALFDRCIKAIPLKIERYGRTIKEFSVFGCYNFKGMEVPEIKKW